uniref:VWFD domain-containing protein n=1 Tax=Equus caballus TaxID=9796 RepID=A0A3Q2I143_HORSE
ITDCMPPAQCGCSTGGRSHPAGEAFWAGEHHERFCHCEASTHTVHCSPSSCRPGQKCGALRGIFGRHPLSPWHLPGIWLPGTCGSVFAESCGSFGLLPLFRVELGKENRPTTKMSIQVNSTQISPRRESIDLAEGRTYWPLGMTLELIEVKRNALAQTK